MLAVSGLRPPKRARQIAHRTKRRCRGIDPARKALARATSVLGSQEAAEQCRIAISINPQYPDAYRNLDAAMQMLDKARSQKAILESQIASLDAQNRLIQASAIGTSMQIDNSKLAQSQKLIDDIKKQLDIAERVISREGKFTEPIQIDTVSEKDLVTQVDDYLAEKTETAAK